MRLRAFDRLNFSVCRLDKSVAAIRTENPNANLRKLILDLASFESIRRAAAEVINYGETIHVRATLDLATLSLLMEL